MLKQNKGRSNRNNRLSKATDKQRLVQTSKNLEKVKNDFDTVTGVCEMIEQSVGERRVFEKVLNLIGKSVEFSQASLYLLDRRKNQMQEVATVGKRVDLIDFVRFDRGIGFSAWVAKEKRPILLSNLHRKRSGETVKSFLAIPLTLNGELFGVMNLSHIRAHAFEKADVDFLSLISAPITLCLERTHCYSESERLESELRQVRECSAELEEEINRLRSRVPTPQLLESLNQKVKTPLSGIADNAQFLLDTFSVRREEKANRSRRKPDLEFKRGLRQIRNEANQVTKATERLLKRSLV